MVKMQKWHRFKTVCCAVNLVALASILLFKYLVFLDGWILTMMSLLESLLYLPLPLVLGWLVINVFFERSF